MHDGTGEIAKIEHEIAMLRERQEIYRRGVVLVRRAIITAGVLLAGMIIVLLALGNIFAAIIVSLLAVSIALSGIRYRPGRRFDLLTHMTMSWYGGHREIRDIEAAISTRRKRIAELQGPTQ